jgi:glycosyltransferase involved in cell wall biosynthesis
VILNGQWAGPVGALASRLAGCCKIVYIARWPAFYSSRDLYRAIRSHLVELIPARLARRTVALSAGNHYQYLIRRLVPESRLRVICNPIDLNRVPHPDDIEALRRENDWNPDACHVVSVGRIVDQKHIDWLLRSWKLVASRAPTARLSIVGSGPMQPRLEELAAELGLGDSVFFLGERPEGIRYIAAADAIVMTTLYEGHANVPLEAMACGKPIVANEVDGVSGSLDDGVEGFLIVPGDIRTFAARLLRMIRSKALRARMGAEGRKRVTQFVLPKIMKQYYALIKEVLCEDGLSPGHDDSRSNQSPRGGFPRAVVGPGSGCAGGGKS